MRLTDLNEKAHVFRHYSLTITLIFAILKNWLIQN